MSDGRRSRAPTITIDLSAVGGSPAVVAGPHPDRMPSPTTHARGRTLWHEPSASQARQRASPKTQRPQSGSSLLSVPQERARYQTTPPPPSVQDEVAFIRQPETKPISQEQLVAEVKGIYAGLVMVESKCIEVDNAQSAQQEAKLNNEQWQALIALHRTLLHEHHDFFLASQLPSASPALRRLASKYAMPARMWRHGIHSFLELLRHRLPAQRDHMLTFIYLAYSMMALLYETVPAFEDTWIECLGDLGRYRMAIEDDNMSDREVWTSVSRHWYSKASDKAPTTRRLYHHLAILARPQALQQLYYYTKALRVTIPFISARESILTLFDPLLQSPANRLKPLPEDCAMRGFCWAEKYFPEYCFSHKYDDDNGKGFELRRSCHDLRQISRLLRFPNPELLIEEAPYGVKTKPFAFSPGQLSKLIKPKSSSALHALSGFDDFEKCLQLQEMLSHTSSTGVAKEASAIILMDDNFSSIVGPLSWGRAITEMCTKLSQFQFVVSISTAILTFAPAVLGAMQPLWVNLIMDTFAALALIPAADSPPQPKLRQLPTGQTADLITPTMWKMIIGQPIYTLLVTATACVSPCLYGLLAHEPAGMPTVEWIGVFAICVAILAGLLVIFNDWYMERQFRKPYQRNEDRQDKVIRSRMAGLESVFDILVSGVPSPETGDVVPVDGIFIDGHNVKCDESPAMGDVPPINGHNIQCDEFPAAAVEPSLINKTLADAGNLVWGQRNPNRESTSQRMRLLKTNHSKRWAFRKSALGLFMASHCIPLAAAALTLSRALRIASGAVASASGVSVIPLRTAGGIPVWTWILTYGVWATAFSVYLWLQTLRIPTELNHRRQLYLFCVIMAGLHLTIAISTGSDSIPDALTMFGPILMTASAFLMSLLLRAIHPGGLSSTSGGQSSASSDDTALTLGAASLGFGP